MEKDKLEVNCKAGSALPFFLIGAATGVALTILLAPRSGAATRRLIGRTVQEGEDWMKAKAAAARDYVTSHEADLRERATEVAEVIGRP
jgi:gas vesicle protein